ncbi:MAG: hypothetical protein WBB07_14080 [Mycobacterium sp.]
MKKFGFAALTAAALAGGALGMAAPTLAAPSGVGSAQDTIKALEAEGYDVVVNRLSSTPLAEASVISVGRNQSATAAMSGADYTPKVYGPVTPTTVYVTVN